MGEKAEEDSPLVTKSDVAVPDLFGGPSMQEMFNYHFDNFMVLPYASFILITIATIINVVVGGGLMQWARLDTPAETTYLENAWWTWKALNDPAAHTDEVGFGPRFVGFLVSLAGIIIMSILMGFIVDLIAISMEELRKGKSKVVEENHTLILGWNEKLFGVLFEICDACKTMADGSEGGVIVILRELTLEY